MGILTGKYLDAKNPPPGTRAAGAGKEMMEDYFTQSRLDAVQELVPVAKRANCSLAQLALAWCLRQPSVTSTIVGATKIEHVDDNVAAADLDLDPSIFAEMDRILVPVTATEAYLA
jgi:aryl-alcohol dehydrogenase-like predicted oxidoreductase